MKISCVLSQAEAQAAPADVLVFPEGVSKKELHATSAQYSHSIVIGAYTDRKACRGALYKAGRNEIDYLKVCSDGRTVGCGDLTQRTIYQEGDQLTIGVVICMDIDHPGFRHQTFQWMRESRSRHKLLCIPADMGGEWLQSETLPWGASCHGFHVLLCNNTQTHPSYRCKSFVTDQFGHKIAIQRETETLMTVLQ